MYTNSEILKIFNSTASLDEVEEVSAAFKWLIDSGFMQKSVFLHLIALQAFIRVT